MSPHIQPDLRYEAPFWKADQTLICGIDEAGRGALAGAVFAAAIILPADKRMLPALSGVRDSKQMTPRQRETWEGKIKEAALSWGVGKSTCQEVDTLGILPATRLAMQRAVEALHIQPVHLLIDAVILRYVDIPQTALIKGDVYCLSIACASVLAKTARDHEMVAFDALYPHYGFARHKGYATLQHRTALQKHGACLIHRRSYEPVRLCLQKAEIPGK